MIPAAHDGARMQAKALVLETQHARLHHDAAVRQHRAEPIKVDLRKYGPST